MFGVSSSTGRLLFSRHAAGRLAGVGGWLGESSSATSSTLASCLSTATRRLEPPKPAQTPSTSTNEEKTSDHDDSSSETNKKCKASFDLEAARREIINIWMLQEAKQLSKSASASASTMGPPPQRTARYCSLTYHDVVRAYRDPRAAWHWLDRELSSNVAGETGAVHVYQGALAASRYVRPLPASALDFCHEHRRTEGRHLALFQNLVPAVSSRNKQTKLLPVWKLAGWMVGFLPTVLAGSKGLYVTVEAIESFVEEHFQEQIHTLQNDPEYQKTINNNKSSPLAPELLAILNYCCADEVHHKEEAAEKLLQGDDHALTAWWISPWRKVVHWGSATAAEIARRI